MREGESPVLVRQRFLSFLVFNENHSDVAQLLCRNCASLLRPTCSEFALFGGWGDFLNRGTSFRIDDQDRKSLHGGDVAAA